MIAAPYFGDRIAPGEYRLHSRFRRAANFVQGNRLVCVVSPEIGAGPINIAIPGRNFSRARVLRVRAGRAALDGHALPALARYDSSFPEVCNPDLARLRENLRFLRRLVLREASPESLAFLLGDDRRRGRGAFQRALRRRARAAARHFRQGRPRAGARAMRGLGLGLTPSGDDFLAGYLWGLHLRSKLCGKNFRREIQTVYAAGRSDNPLSAAFLRCAREGRLFEKPRRLIEALLWGETASVAKSARAVLAMGAGSGADVSAGLWTALRKENTLWPSKH